MRELTFLEFFPTVSRGFAVVVFETKELAKASRG